MKIRIDVQDGMGEEEIVIRCARIDERIQRIHQYIADQAAGRAQIVFYKDNREFYFPAADVLFFETEDDAVFAHTAKDSYRIKFRLYELEDMLGSRFVRVSKSTILNADQVLSVTRNLTASSLVEFRGSHKRVYVSRRYYHELRRKLDERSNI